MILNELNIIYPMQFILNHLLINIVQNKNIIIGGERTPWNFRPFKIGLGNADKK